MPGQLVEFLMWRLVECLTWAIWNRHKVRPMQVIYSYIVLEQTCFATGGSPGAFSGCVFHNTPYSSCKPCNRCLGSYKGCTVVFQGSIYL